MRTSSLTVWRFLLIISCVLSSFSPASLQLFREDSGNIDAFGLSELAGTARVQVKPSTSSLGDKTIRIEHHDQRIYIWTITPTEDIIWESPIDWRVTEAFFSDLNRDGQQELSLLVWRAYRPWPVDRLLHFEGLTKNYHDENGSSCQLILLKWDGSQIKEAWAGSALASPIHDLQVLDMDGDGYQELAALEQPYDSQLKGSSVVLWRWNGFGFSLDDRMQGKFTSLSTLVDRNRDWLLIH